MIRKALVAAGLLGITYMAFAFVGMELNPAMWGMDARFFFVICGGCGAVMATTMPGGGR